MSSFPGESEWYELERAEPPRASRWKNNALGFALLVIAILIFELTANPSLGVVVGCLKMSEIDVRTALWLRRVDPDPRRGRTCSWYYLTFGIIKTGIVALCALFAFFFIARCFGPLAQLPAPVNQQGITAILTLFSCYVIAGFTSCVGVFSALRSGIKVWVSPVVHRSQRENRWPPGAYVSPRSRSNTAGLLCLLSAAAICALALALYITFGVYFIWNDTNRLLVKVNDPMAQSFAVFLAAGFIVAAVLFPCLARFLSARTVASNARECYPT